MKHTTALKTLVIASFLLPLQMAPAHASETGRDEFVHPFKNPAVDQPDPVFQRQPIPRPRSSVPRVFRRPLERAPSGGPPDGELRFVQDEVIVRFQRTSAPASRRQLVDRLGILHLEGQTFELAGVTVHRYRIPAARNVPEIITQLEQSRAVVNAQPNYIYETQQSGTVAKLPQYAVDRIGLSDAHAFSKGEGVRIAIIDTAIDWTHPELTDAQATSFDVSDAPGSNADPHGTALAGVLAAAGKLSGVAPKSELLGITAFTRSTNGKMTGNTWTVSKGLDVALEQGADILNLSFAGPRDPLVERAMEGAQRRDMLPVAAAGNAGPNAPSLFPAAYDAVVAVTATNAQDAIYANANQGDYVDLAAPGVDVLVLDMNSGYRTSSGTSMATAYVSGIAALASSSRPGVSHEALVNALENAASDLGNPGKDPVFGAGIPNAGLAAQAPSN